MRDRDVSALPARKPERPGVNRRPAWPRPGPARRPDADPDGHERHRHRTSLRDYRQD
jgi:hypothetical protein